jgi:hypothetical protein
MPAPSSATMTFSDASASANVRRTCASCATDEETLRLKRAAGQAGGPTSTDFTRHVQGRVRFGGTPLPPSARGFLEPRQINARASTLGQDTFFAPGELRPPLHYHRAGGPPPISRRVLGAEDHTVQARRTSPQAAAPSHRGVGLGASGSALVTGGSPLPAATRKFFESRMNRDLSHVRLHRSEHSNQLNGEIGARAFTFLNHIWLGENVGHEPNFVLAHELAHVAQQTGPDEGDTLGVSSAPPSIQRLAPPGNCEQDEHDNMQRLVKEFCDPPTGWSGGTTRTWRECRTSDSCGQLKLKITRNQMCGMHRRIINDKCYNGGDEGHRNAESNARRGQAKCEGYYRNKCEKKKKDDRIPVPAPKLTPAAQRRLGTSAVIGGVLGGILGLVIGGGGGAAVGTLALPGGGTVGGGVVGGTAGALKGVAIGTAAGAAVGTMLQSLWEWARD